MRIPARERVGGNPQGRTNREAAHQNIHLEHTLQVSQFRTELWPCRPQEEAAAVRYLMKYTPTTAMTYHEKGTLGRGDGRNHRNGALDDGPTRNQPFARYRVLQDSVVWNVFRRKPIDLMNYSFDDHFETIRDLVVNVDGPVWTF